MKTKLVWCPLCEKRLTQLKPTVYECKLCKTVLELTKLNYSPVEGNMVLTTEYTIVDNSE